MDQSVSSLHNVSSSSTSRITPYRGGSASPQGTFVQRLCQVEEANRSLRQELLDLKQWKTCVETWLMESFGFVPGEIRNDDDTLSNTSRTSRDTNATPEVNSDSYNFAIVKTEPNLEEEEKLEISRNSSSTIPTPLNSKVSHLTTEPELESRKNLTEESAVETELDGNVMDTTVEIPEVEEVPVSEKSQQVHEIAVIHIGEEAVTPAEAPKSSSSSASMGSVQKAKCNPDADSITSTSNHVMHMTPLFSKGSSEKNHDHPKPYTQCRSNSNLTDVSSAFAGEERIEDMDLTPCDVCQYQYTETQNEMIYCETCNICVHQACYGVTQVPDGEWNCQPCDAKIPVSEQVCRFCIMKGGAMVRVKSPSKKTWAHVSCTWWIPGVRIHNPLKMDYVTGLPDIEKRRWNLLCYLCKKGKGSTCCVQCIYRRCPIAFHVTCGYKNGLRMEMLDKKNNEPDGVNLYAFCPSHRMKSIEEALLKRASTQTPLKKRRKTEG